MNVVTRNDRLKRFGTTLGVVWGIWIPLLATPQWRDFTLDHPLIALLQGPLVATGTLLIGEWGRSRSSGPAE